MISTERSGRILAGRYRLELELGAGASAQVWRAFDLRLARRVAVKLLHPGLQRDESFLRRFRAEAQIVAQLNHPHLLRVFDWGEEHDGAFLVGEYLAGGSLRDLFDRSQQLSLEQTVALGISAAQGLAYAHRRGLVHRDIKPANLLFDEEGEVRIADFGLARALAEAAWTEPSGAVLGTARYSSPEQAEGRPLDGRSDVYSLALVLYEAVMGQVPFAQETTLATLQARIGRRLPPARALGALYPILAEAAMADPIARLEAADLVVELELLAATMARPLPLPIVLHPEPEAEPAPRGAAVGAPTERVTPPEAVTMSFVVRDLVPDDARDDDTTVMAATPAARTDERGSGPAFYDLAVDGDPDDGGVGYDDDTEMGYARPRRRRRIWLRAAIALVVLLGAVAGAFAIDRTVLVRHTVPGVRGATLASAESQFAKAGITLRQGASVFSVAVPTGDVVSEVPAAGTVLGRNAKVTVTLSKGAAPVTLPTIAGLSLRSVEHSLAGLHLTHVVRRAYSDQVANGIVISSTPASGTVAYGSKVTLVVSRGPAPRTIPGNLVGSSWANAQSAIQALRLVAAETLAYSTTVASGDVISTSPAPGTSGVREGSTVQVTVSEGPPSVPVPNVQGDSVQSAVAMLRSDGLDVTEVIGPPFATTAVTTSPSPGTSVQEGSAVTLYAS